MKTKIKKKIIKKKTYWVSADFIHSVDFYVKTTSPEYARKLVEKHQFDGMNSNVKFEDGDFGGLIGVGNAKEIDEETGRIK